MGFLRRQQAKPAEPVTSHAVDLADSSDNESDSGSDASCSAPQSSTGIYNDKKTLRSSESDWTCTVQPSRRGFFLRASASIALPLPVEAAFGLFFGGNILPWRHFEVMSLSWAQDASWECPPWRHSHSLPHNPPARPRPLQGAGSPAGGRPGCWERCPGRRSRGSAEAACSCCGSSAADHETASCCTDATSTAAALASVPCTASCPIQVHVTQVIHSAWC